MNNNLLPDPKWFIPAVLLYSLLVASVCGAVEIDMEKIAQIESSNNPLAWNKKDDSRGLFQITPICLEDYNNFHPKAKHTMDDLWNVSISTLIADWYINQRIPQMLRYYDREDTVENRIIAFNAGISYVVSGKSIPKITKDYLRKYGELK